MDIESFYQLSPEEFEVIYSKWSETRDAEFRTQWEQTRLICYWSIVKPKSIKTIKAFMPLPWDKKKEQGGRKSGKSHEKIKDQERFERLKKEYGGTI